MANARLRFTWRLTFAGDRLMAAEVLPDVTRVMKFWVNHPKYSKKFTDLHLGGYQYGRLEVAMTITAHDQWRCRQRAAWISRALMSAAHVRYVEVADPQQDRLPPHEHRGSRRFEAPKYREALSG
jgi:hypothetical protein